MSKQASTGLFVAAMVLIAGLLLAGYPFNAYSIVAMIFAICAGFITWIYMRTNDEENGSHTKRPG